MVDPVVVRTAADVPYAKAPHAEVLHAGAPSSNQAEQLQQAGSPAHSKVQLVNPHGSRSHSYAHTSRCVMRVDAHCEGSPGAHVQPVSGHPGLVVFSGVLGNRNAILSKGKRRLTHCRQAVLV